MADLSKRWSVLLVLGFAFCVAQKAMADQDDPPDRVARFAYAQGSVSFQPAGTSDWVAAVANRPVTIGDKLWTDKNSRAELQIGSAAIRLGSETGFSFLNLSNNMTQIRLTAGVVSIHLRHLVENEAMEVDTPNLAFSLLRPGDYRLEVNDEGNLTVVSVRSGEGEVTGTGQAFTVHSNQRVTFTGTDQLASDIDGTGNFDEFDRWCRDRDEREDRAPSSRYVSRDVIGYQDLDGYGSWRTVPDYGPMWVPSALVADWAPYRFGHWVWISPWGWTWVDDAPWGFAPFHYGRWAYVGGVWGWCPGPIAIARPVYAPALVAWVGGPHFSIGIGGIGAAWFPLGPREVYVPPYRASRSYVTNVNVTNTTVNNTYVTNVYNNYTTNNTSVSQLRYVNRTAPGAVTATSQTAFASAQPIQRNMVKVDQRQLAQAQVATNIGVVPQQKSVLGAAGRAVRPPATVQSRTVMARATPPPAPVAFAREQPAIQSNAGQPPAVQQSRRLESQSSRASAPVRVVQPAVKPVPIESAAPVKPAQAGQANRTERTVSPANRPQGEPNSPPQPAPRPNQRVYDDRPPSAQQRAQSPGNPGEVRPGNANPSRVDRPTQPPRDALSEQQHQQQQKLQDQQEQQRQRLEQKHQQQLQRAQQQTENQRQQEEHQRLQLKQEREVQRLEQNQQRERQKVQQHNPH
jgi:hypothetical protein